MKKIIYLFFALLIFSCSKDDDKSNDLNSIEGRWNLLSNSEQGGSSELSSCDLASYMTLANGLGDFYIYRADSSTAPCTLGEVQAFSYSADGIRSNTYYLTLTQDNETDDGEIVMKVNGNSLTMTETTYNGDVYTSTFIRD